jgi:hypothetical protein
MNARASRAACFFGEWRGILDGDLNPVRKAGFGLHRIDPPHSQAIATEIDHAAGGAAIRLLSSQRLL